MNLIGVIAIMAEQVREKYAVHGDALEYWTRYLADLHDDIGRLRSEAPNAAWEFALHGLAMRVDRARGAFGRWKLSSPLVQQENPKKAKRAKQSLP